MSPTSEDERQPLLSGRRRPDTGIDRRSEVEIEMQESPGVASFTYSWKDVCARVRDPVNRPVWNILGRNEPEMKATNLLTNATGMARPGELTVVMGSSGAGKSTLLNALTFRTRRDVDVTGIRLVNGVPATRSTVISLSGYVQQEEVFLSGLTVREHLAFQAMVRMDGNATRRSQRVDDVIDELGLRSCENTAIRSGGSDTSGISGGERKRLSFATEVLTDPPMMFCDEPTSGLDSVMALNVVSVLTSMARKGKTVVCTVHQPSSEMYAMFDRIILVAEGRIAFHGTRDDASSFFERIGTPCPVTYNPADFYIQLLAVSPLDEGSSREMVDAICESFETSPEGLKLMSDVETFGMVKRIDTLKGVTSRRSPQKCQRYKADWSHQMRALLWRSWLCVIKDPLLVKMRLFQNIVVSIMLSLLYHGQRNDEDGVFNLNGVLFTFLTNMTFQNMFAVITVFCSERPVFLREHLNGLYRVDVYFLSKTLAEIPIFFALPVMCVVITYYAVGLNPGIDHFAVALCIVVLVANVATSFGYFISSISSTMTMALSIGPPVIIPFLLFGGFLLNTRNIPNYFYWLSYLSWFKHGNEALLINQWSDVEVIECRTVNSSCPRNGQSVLEMYNFRDGDLVVDIILLVVLIVAFRILAFATLLLKTLRK